MEVASSFIGKTLKKLSSQSKSEARGHVLILFSLGDLVAHLIHPSPNQIGAPAEIDHTTSETFIHGDVGFGSEGVFGIESVPISSNPLFIAQSLDEGLSQGDSTVFDCVMSVYLHVAATSQLQIHHTVFREQTQHVIEERDSRFDVIVPFSIDIKGEIDFGFPGMPPDAGPSLLHFPALNTVRSKRKREKSDHGLPGGGSPVALTQFSSFSLDKNELRRPFRQPFR